MEKAPKPVEVFNYQAVIIYRKPATEEELWLSI